MKKMFFVIVLAFLANFVQAQDLPSFVPPVHVSVSTNSQSPSELLQAVRAIFPTNLLSAQVETTSTPALSQEEKEKKKKAESVKRLLALNEKVQAERRAATGAVVTNSQQVASKTNLPPTINLLAKTVKPKKAGKNAQPPLFVAPDSVTNYVAPQKPAEVYVYKQGLWYPTNEAQVAMRERAIARLEGKEGSVWNSGSTQAAKSQEYAADQRPLDQGTQPASAVAHYPTHQGNYATYQGNYPTAPATYAVQSAHPVYAEQGIYYPVPHYATYGSYPTYGYTYPAYGYGVGYVSRRSLFGISFDAAVSPSYNYSPGWSVRAGGHHSHRQVYSTYHSGGHHQSHQATYPTYSEHRGRR